MSTHAPTTVQEVARAADGQRTYFLGCECGSWPCGVFRACVRPLDDGHEHNGETCWALIENADGTATFSPSLDLSKMANPHFHTAKPFTTALTTGRELF